MPKANDIHRLQTALSLHRNGKLGEAAKLYRQLITRNSNDFHALHYLALIEAASGNMEQARIFMARSMRISPPKLEFIENYATILFQAGDYQTAIIICQQGFDIKRENPSLLYLSAISFLKLKQMDESLTHFEELIKLYPDHIEALNECASVLAIKKKYSLALERINKALTLRPNYAEAYLNRGNIYCELKRFDEAIANYDKALSIEPALANASLGLGNALGSTKRYDEAFAAYDKALAINPGLEGAWLGRGNILYDLTLYEKALEAYEKALSINPNLENAWHGQGNVYQKFKRYDEAFAAYDRAFSLNPGFNGVEGARIHAKMLCCKWSDFHTECAHLISSVREEGSTNPPFSLLCIPSSAEDQLVAANRWVAANCPRSNKPLWQGARYNHDRIRVGYLSADFREHPVSHLITGVLEGHDRNRFDVKAISLGRSDDSQVRRRLEASVETFINVDRDSDEEIARLIRRLEIDILVDLMGFTSGSRTQILAQKPAPIQVNYLGYPGTMGAGYIDYIIADPILIPVSQESCYAEKVVRLPNSYLPHDENSRTFAKGTFGRAEFELPMHRFVFCCFNNAYKLNPDGFSSWMRVLNAVEGSVLWLSDPGAAAAKNLRMEASSAGVSPDRLIFAKRLPSPADHLARLHLADLFLDTRPFNAHTTASDALWAGLPVLTQIGETFAGRVAASVLNAVGLPELVTGTPESYELMAIDLARHPEKMAAIKRRLDENRLTMPLFDTALFIKHIEKAYVAMHERHQAILPADHIAI